MAERAETVPAGSAALSAMKNPTSKDAEFKDSSSSNITANSLATEARDLLGKRHSLKSDSARNLCDRCIKMLRAQSHQWLTDENMRPAAALALCYPLLSQEPLYDLPWKEATLAEYSLLQSDIHAQLAIGPMAVDSYIALQNYLLLYLTAEDAGIAMHDLGERDVSFLETVLKQAVDTFSSQNTFPQSGYLALFFAMRNTILFQTQYNRLSLVAETAISTFQKARKMLILSTAVLPGYASLLFHSRPSLHHWARKSLNKCFKDNCVRITSQSLNSWKLSFAHAIKMFCQVVSCSDYHGSISHNLKKHWQTLLMLLRCFDASSLLKIANAETCKPLIFQISKELNSSVEDYELKTLVVSILLYLTKGFHSLSSQLFFEDTEDLTSQRFELTRPLFARAISSLETVRSDSSGQSSFNKLDQQSLSTSSETMDAAYLEVISSMATNLAGDFHGLIVSQLFSAIQASSKLIPSAKLKPLLISLIESSFDKGTVVKNYVIKSSISRDIAYDAVRLLESIDTLSSTAMSGKIVKADADTLREYYLASRSRKYTGPVVPTSKQTMTLWRQYFTNRLIDSEALQQRLELAMDACYLDSLNRLMMNKDDFRASFNTSIDACQKCIQDLLENVMGSSEDQKLSLMAMRSIFSAVFAFTLNPSVRISQTAFSILSDIFQENERHECIRQGLLNNFSACLNGFVIALEQWRLLQSYEGARRILITTQYFLEASLAPGSGSLDRAEIAKKDNMLSLLKYWKALWQMMSDLYDITPELSRFIDKQTLTEFARDAIDMTRNLTRSFIRIDSICQKRGLSELVNEFLQPWNSMIIHFAQWLRLTESYLLNNTVQIVLEMMALMKKHKFKIENKLEQTLLHFANLGTQAQSRLTESQKMQILLFFESPKSQQVELNLVLKRSTEEAGLQSRDVHKKGAITQLNGLKSAVHNDHYSKKLLNSQPVLRDPMRPEMKSTSFEEKTKPLYATYRRPLHEIPSVEQAITSQKHLEASNETMRDSSSSSSSSSDESDDLFSEVKKELSVPKIRTTARHEIKIFDSQLPFQRPKSKLKEMDALKNAKARLNPDLSPLFKQILLWDPNDVDKFPPNVKLSDVQAVKASYSNVSLYSRTFEKLLFLEVWESIQQSREEAGNNCANNFTISILERATVNGFFEITARVENVEKGDLRLGDRDLLVVTVEDRDKDKVVFYAKVSSLSRTQILIFQCTIANKAVHLLSPGSKGRCQHVMSLQTVCREYAALKGLEYYTLSHEIIFGIPSAQSTYVSSEVAKIRDKFRLNESQAQAVVSCLKSTGFSLIQGPPGTGKTKLITSFVQQFLELRRTEINGIAIANRDFPRLLICAPSNAAVDELLSRILQLDCMKIDTQKSSSKKTPKVIRLGPVDKISPKNHHVALDYLTSLSENGIEDVTKFDSQMQNIQNELRQINQERKALLDRRSSLKNNAEDSKFNDRIKTLTKNRNDSSEKLEQLRRSRQHANRSRDIAMRGQISRLIENASIICATLSGAGSEQLTNLSLTFDTVIIDEAAQAIELSTMIPLKYGCNHCILVGDPNQLPPTVLSKAASSFSYEQSLFVRMQNRNPDAVHLLDTQYRMHPDICHIPSLLFYDSKLKDADSCTKLNKREWHSDKYLAPYRFFNIVGEQSTHSHSSFNMSEVNFVIKLLTRLKENYREVDFTGKIGVITPYKAQYMKLRNSLISRFGREILDEVDINTVDGFQGQEKEIIILSTVRGTSSQGIGFVADVRRINVAITRAQTTLMIVGNQVALRRNDMWRRLIDISQERNCIINIGKSSNSEQTGI